MKSKVIICTAVLIFICSTRAQMSFSPFIDSVKDLCTYQTLSKINRQLTGDTTCIIGGSTATIQSRYWGMPSNSLAAQFIYEHLTAYGLNAIYMDYSETGRNVYAVKPGTKYPNQKFIICSHYDDMPSGNIAPGADDNGSGTCAVLEAARLLSPYLFDYTIVFIAFDEEERGLYGSHAYADSCFDRSDSILGVFNYDMIAYDGNNDMNLDIICNTNSLTFSDNTVMLYYMYQPQILAIRILNNSMSASDHWYFWQRNYKAFLGIEDMNDMTPFIHSVNDKFSSLKMDFFLGFTRAAIATLMTYAGNYFMTINHPVITSSGNTGPNTAVVTIKSPNPIAKLTNAPRLYYKVGEGAYSYLNSYYNNLDTFLFQIPGQPVGSAVSYYIAAQDSLGKYVGTLPWRGRGISPPGTTPPPTVFTYYILTGIANEQEPVSFSLGQNYPNPFNSSTDIKLQLARNSEIELKITDVLGRTVMLAAQGRLPKGENIIRIDANSLATGVYFYSLSLDGAVVETRRMVLVK